MADEKKKRGRKASGEWTFKTVSGEKHKVKVNVTLNPALPQTRIQELVLCGLRAQAAAAFKRDLSAMEPEISKNREFLTMAKALTSDESKIKAFMLGKQTELPTEWAYDGSTEVEEETEGEDNED